MTRKITVYGTRGIPNIQGGVETHCQSLYSEIKSKFDFDICIIARSPYVQRKRRFYHGIEVYAMWAPKLCALEAIVHTFLSACRSCFDGSDIVHIHAIGPGIVIPLLRLLGKKVVFTHHGPDYERKKWGWFAKKVLMLGERVAVKYANEVIVISDVINNIIQHKYGRADAHLIYNGVTPPHYLQFSVLQSKLTQFNLRAKNYIVVVGRFVEEKGLHDAIAAWKTLNLSMPLVLVGDADHPTEYSNYLIKLINHTPNVIMTGFLTGDNLQAVFSQARLFLMPSYHEGLPLVLLEAMAYSLPVVVSDIPANIEVSLPESAYFKVGDISDFALKISIWISTYNVDYSEYLKKYSWSDIARDTVDVYNHCI